MNILVVSSYLPYPLHSGGDVRLYNLLKRLAKKHTITLICEKRSHQTETDVSEIKKICKEVITVPRRKQWSIKNILKSGFSTHSFLINGHTLPDMQEEICNQLKTNQFDLIHIETSYVMQNIPQTSLPIVLTEHNMEYQVYQKYADNKPFPIRQLLEIDISKLKREEEQFWQRAKIVVVVSEQEKDVVKKIVENVEVVANGVDTKVFQPKLLKETFSNKERRFLYIGNYKWIQNQNALSWILTDMWPHIASQTDQSVKLWIVGRDLPPEFEKFASDRVIVEGVSNRPTQDLFSEAYALLAPLKIAGGTQYKILESMAVGTPVITTPLGSIGLSVKNKKEILVGESAEEIVTLCLHLLQNQELYETLAKESREHIEKYFSFDAIAEKLEKVYRETIVRDTSS